MKNIKKMRHFLSLTLIIISIPFLLFGQTKTMEYEYDVVITGASASGIAAAINAAREGVDVLMTESTGHLGGLATGGLSNTDFMTYESVGGTWREFMDRVVDYYTKNYGKGSRQVRNCMDGGYYEPKVGLQIFKEMLEEHENNIDIWLLHQLETVETRMKPEDFYRVEAIRVKDIQSSDVKRIKGKVFIDATYEGDLMAAAGCGYRVGSESRAEYKETIAAEKANWHVQCYNFRPTLTNDPDKRLPINKPDGYNRDLYAPLIEFIDEGHFDDLSQIISDNRPLPNKKADFNDKKGSPISMRVCNETDVWPEANPKNRQLIFEYIKRHNMGFLYFLQNDSELPEWIKKDMGQWGLPKDEFTETHHWPPVVYVREGRRMIGEYVFTQYDAQPKEGSVRAPAKADAVAIGDYALNSHGTHEPKPGLLKGELSGKTKPFQVSYRVMIPKKVDGLLVPVAVSASRVGFGAIRMEPVWTALGQAAGLAAAQAIKSEKEARAIDVSLLQIKLHELEAKTFYVSDVHPSSPYFKAVQFLGNRGFFQHLYKAEDASGKKREGLPAPPQNKWSTAFPYHDVKPEKQMTARLAEYWMEMAGIADKETFPSFEKMSRGKFLQEIYIRLIENNK